MTGALPLTSTAAREHAALLLRGQGIALAHRSHQYQAVHAVLEQRLLHLLRGRQIDFQRGVELRGRGRKHAGPRARTGCRHGGFHIGVACRIVDRIRCGHEQQDTIAVIGAGVIGAAVAFALAREGRQVLLLDRAEPGVAGASFGNVGHIAAELVQPLPSPGLLFGFWRELYRFGGALDLRRARRCAWLPWIGSFAAAAFQARAEHTAFGAAGAALPPRHGRAGSGNRPAGAAEAARALRDSDSAGKAAADMRAMRDDMAQLGVKTRAGHRRAARAAAARRKCSDGAAACGSRTPRTCSILWRRSARWRRRR